MDWGWVPAAITAAAAIFVGIAGGQYAHRTKLASQTTPAYAELVTEVRQYRTEAREDRERIEELEAARDEERRLRRELDGRVVCLERAKDQDRSWIRRTITAIRHTAPEHLGLLRPFPDWHQTDPEGIPVVPDDGQPGNITRP